MIERLSIGTAVLGVALIAAPAFGYAQATDIGKREYLNSCAVCHGIGGKGDGPLAAQLKKAVPDLTQIEKKNMFPLLYGIIDGREAVLAHGPRDMPVWGLQYSSQASELTGGLGTPEQLESFTRGRIIALIGYIYSLQAK